MSTTFFVIDNRSFPADSFASVVCRNSINISTLSLLGRYIQLQEYHNDWIPVCRILYASSSKDIQEMEHPANVQYLPRLASTLEPKYSCHELDITKSSWEYLSSGLQRVINYVVTGKCDKEQLKLVICLIISDRALLQSAQDRPVISGDPSHGERLRFRKVCSQLSNKVSEHYGGKAQIVLRIACAMTTRLPTGDINLLSHVSRSSREVETEVNKVRAELATITAQHEHRNLDLTFSTFLPSPLFFDEQLRHIIAAHAPNFCAKLELPYHQDKVCSVVVKLSAVTLTGADALWAWFGTSNTIHVLGDIYDFIPRARLPATFIAGPALIVEAAELSGKGDPSHHNCLAFAALAVAQIQLDAIIVIRSTQTSGESAYWALVPPANHTALGSCMTLLKLVDKESVLMASDVLLTSADDATLTSYPDGLNVAHSTNGSKALHTDASFTEHPIRRESIREMNAECLGLELEDKPLFQDTVWYMKSTLLENFGNPTPYNPMSCPTAKLDIALSQILRAGNPVAMAIAGAQASCATQASAQHPMNSEQISRHEQSTSSTSVFMDHNQRCDQKEEFVESSYYNRAQNAQTRPVASKKQSQPLSMHSSAKAITKNPPQRGKVAGQVQPVEHISSRKNPQQSKVIDLHSNAESVSKSIVTEHSKHAVLELEPLAFIAADDEDDFVQTVKTVTPPTDLLWSKRTRAAVTRSANGKPNGSDLSNNAKSNNVIRCTDVSGGQRKRLRRRNRPRDRVVAQHAFSTAQEKPSSSEELFSDSIEMSDDEKEAEL